jgi:hypothetical protein
MYVEECSFSTEGEDDIVVHSSACRDGSGSFSSLGSFETCEGVGGGGGRAAATNKQEGRRKLSRRVSQRSIQSSSDVDKAELSSFEADLERLAESMVTGLLREDVAESSPPPELQAALPASSPADLLAGAIAAGQLQPPFLQGLVEAICERTDMDEIVAALQVVAEADLRARQAVEGSEAQQQQQQGSTDTNRNTNFTAAGTCVSPINRKASVEFQNRRREVMQRRRLDLQQQRMPFMRQTAAWEGHKAESHGGTPTASRLHSPLRRPFVPGSILSTACHIGEHTPSQRGVAASQPHRLTARARKDHERRSGHFDAVHMWLIEARNLGARTENGLTERNVLFQWMQSRLGEGGCSGHEVEIMSMLAEVMEASLHLLSRGCGTVDPSRLLEHAAVCGLINEGWHNSVISRSRGNHSRTSCQWKGCPKMARYGAEMHDEARFCDLHRSGRMVKVVPLPVSPVMTSHSGEFYNMNSSRFASEAGEGDDEQNLDAVEAGKALMRMAARRLGGFEPAIPFLLRRLTAVNPSSLIGEYMDHREEFVGSDSRETEVVLEDPWWANSAAHTASSAEGAPVGGLPPHLDGMHSVLQQERRALRSMFGHYARGTKVRKGSILRMAKDFDICPGLFSHRHIEKVYADAACLCKEEGGLSWQGFTIFIALIASQCGMLLSSRPPPADLSNPESAQIQEEKIVRLFNWMDASQGRATLASASRGATSIPPLSPPRSRRRGSVGG